MDSADSITTRAGHLAEHSAEHVLDDDDALLFADEDDGIRARTDLDSPIGSQGQVLGQPIGAGVVAGMLARQEPWKILIVDDDKEIHDVTRLALDDIRFDGRGLQFLSAFSGIEARELAAQHDDIALILLDVVMETEHAGLDVVRYVREELGNRFSRIILRTGQPGQAPEQDVIVEYDINDYKAKTELTQQRMFTMVYTSLSSYRDLVALEANRAGLNAIIEASPAMFDLRSAGQFDDSVLAQLVNLLYLGKDAPVARTSAFAAVATDRVFHIVAGLGRYAGLTGRLADAPPETIPARVVSRIALAVSERHSVAGEHFYVGFLRSEGRPDSVIYAEGERPFTVPDWQLVELYCRNVNTARENLALKREIEDTQREIVYLLGEAIEKRSNETGNHVRRVGEYCRLLGRLSGLPEEEGELLFMAAPLHDAGKIAIPDAILNKPGRHTPDETTIMRTHAQHGADLLSGYQRPVLQAAAIIAAQHHERWDGSGYPRGLAGQNIHLYGRIASLADVFDALGSDRCYKKAWPLDEILTEIRAQRGKQFDPTLVDLFIDNLEGFIEIRDRFRDDFEG